MATIDKVASEWSGVKRGPEKPLGLNSSICIHPDNSRLVSRIWIDSFRHHNTYTQGQFIQSCAVFLSPHVSVRTEAASGLRSRGTFFSSYLKTPQSGSELGPNDWSTAPDQLDHTKCIRPRRIFTSPQTHIYDCEITVNPKLATATSQPFLEKKKTLQRTMKASPMPWSVPCIPCKDSTRLETLHLSQLTCLNCHF
jgi:hypothetical protein